MSNLDSSKEIVPISHPLQAVVQVPGSKSLTNRVLMIAALAEGQTILQNALYSDDSLYFASALKQLGFDLSLDAEHSEMNIKGQGGRIPASNAELFIGNAGTAARFLTAFLTLGKGDFILDGDARMRERPIGDLVSALRQLGGKIAAVELQFSSTSRKPLQSICLPVEIHAAGLQGGRARIAGNNSSQFLSSLLMVAPYAKNAVELLVTTNVNSEPYIGMTLGVMSDFGVEVTKKGKNLYEVLPAKYKARQVYTIESDASAASYFFAIPAILGGTVRVENISRNSRQGDLAFLDVLQNMGCSVVNGVDFIEVTGPSLLIGVDVDMHDFSDTVQTLAAIAPFASSPTHIHGVDFIRNKESDRISDTCTELSRLGVEVREYEDGFSILPCARINPATVHTYNDHRMAMAFALIGLRAAGVRIENPGCVSKTFPDYFRKLDKIR